MPTPSEQLLSRTSYVADGVTTDWNFSFSSGYLDKAHVKAYTKTPAGVRTDLTVVSGDFLGAYQLRISPAVASGDTLTIYRDTPKDAPLVDFTDGANFDELSLDTLAKQAVFIAAEVFDALNLVVGPEILALVAQAHADALAAAASASLAQAQVALAEGFAADAEAAATTVVADATAAIAATISGLMQPYVDAASGFASSASASSTLANDSAIAAIAAKSQALAAQAMTESIAGAFVGTFGFTGPVYDFGSITDATTYLNLDAGVLP